MVDWKLVTLVLCSYGFWKEFRPAVPFLTPYLVSPLKNFTDVQLYSEVYPFWTYSYMAILLPVFILTDLLRYTPVIILEASALIATWVILIWASTIPFMQLMQFFFGLATAAEVAYYAYIYARVDSRYYQKVTSYVRGAALAGRCLAYGLGQLLISTQTTDYLFIQYISLASVVLALFLAVLLLIFDLTCKETTKKLPEDPLLEKKEEVRKIGTKEYIKTYFKELFSNFIKCYSSGFVIKWSIWWALATCGFFQIGNYIQNLWEPLQREQSSVYNGVTEAVNTLLGTIVALTVQFLHINWSLVGELALGLLTLISAGLLITISQTGSIIIAYIFYVLYSALYQMLITIATFNVAKNLETSSYGLIIGCNTFIALILQALLTFLVADKNGFALNINNQFLVYGCYTGVIAIVYLIMAVYIIKKAGLRNVATNFWEKKLEKLPTKEEFIEVKPEEN